MGVEIGWTISLLLNSEGIKLRLQSLTSPCISIIRATVWRCPSTNISVLVYQDSDWRRVNGVLTLSFVLWCVRAMWTPIVKPINYSVFETRKSRDGRSAIGWQANAAKSVWGDEGGGAGYDRVTGRLRCLWSLGCFNENLNTEKSYWLIRIKHGTFMHRRLLET